MPNNTIITNIAEKYIPIKSSDCRIVKAKKQWKQQQLVKEITNLLNDTIRATKEGL